VPLNVEDDPARCSFLAPAVVRRGDLVVAISTSGRSPALAVRLRQRLEAELGPGHARFLALAARFRAPLLAAVPSFAERRRRWYELVDSDALLLLSRGDELSAARRFVELLGVAPQAAEVVGRTATREPPIPADDGEERIGWEGRWTA
jgi:siroheme synthase-like protein